MAITVQKLSKIEGVEIYKLPARFTGVGEVGGFEFERIIETSDSYCYKVSSEGHVWCETFFKRYTPLCIDFAKRVYSEKHFKEIYPKAKDFGVWAWTRMSL